MEQKKRKFSLETRLKMSLAKKGNNTRLGYKHTEETKKKISLSNTGKLSSQWKGNDIKYQAIHVWLRNTFGKANKCECLNCPKISKNYEWALIDGKKYERKRENFIMMDKSCHRKYDKINKKQVVSKTVEKVLY